MRIIYLCSKNPHTGDLKFILDCLEKLLKDSGGLRTKDHGLSMDYETWRPFLTLQRKKETP